MVIHSTVCVDHYHSEYTSAHLIIRVLDHSGLSRSTDCPRILLDVDGSVYEHLALHSHHSGSQGLHDSIWLACQVLEQE